jgi:hypothetical protein
MKKLYGDYEEGIASTVGTIFALMIFTSLLTMFIVQVVPVQIKQNEAEHDMHVLSQFSQMRSVVDLMVLTKDTNYTSYVPIKLGANGVAIVSSPTYGQLAVWPVEQNTPFRMGVKFTDAYGNQIYQNSTGSIQFIAPNRYYVPEAFSYENGAVVRYNFDSHNAVMPIKPSVKVEPIGNGVNMSFTLQSIYGPPVSVAGVETRSVGLALEGISNFVYNAGGNDVTISVDSNYIYGSMYINLTDAWISALQEILNSTGLVEGVDYDVSPTAITIHNAYNVNIRMVYIHVEVGL